jgi:hypothetical protein
MSQEKTERELQEIFERVGCPGRGPRFDASLLRPEQGLRTMLERHRRGAQIWLRDVRTKHVPTMGPVYFDYIENLEINAFAFESHNYDFVGVYVGTIVTIYTFFASLLAYPRLLLSIGNPLAEEEWKSYTVDPKLLFSRQPRDIARRSFAHLLATTAIDFLFAHEIGHLMNGHVKFLRMRRGMPLVAEFDPTQKTREENLTLQTLEMDADCFAVGQGLATAIGRASDPDHVFPPDWRRWYGTPRLALFTWTLATYGLFRLFFKSETNLDDLDSTNHPPSKHPLEHGDFHSGGISKEKESRRPDTSARTNC